MTNRERTLAVLNYQPYDRLPIAHFGYWEETLLKWADEGHLSKELAWLVEMAMPPMSRSAAYSASI